VTAIARWGSVGLTDDRTLAGAEYGPLTVRLSSTAMARWKPTMGGGTHRIGR
jgi:hypothetical protein